MLSGGKQQAGTKKQSERRTVQAGGNRPADTGNGLGTASAGHQDGGRTERWQERRTGGEAAAGKRSINGGDCWHGDGLEKGRGLRKRESLWTSVPDAVAFGKCIRRIKGFSERFSVVDAVPFGKASGKIGTFQKDCLSLMPCGSGIGGSEN